jgi:hypothetical protein
MLEKWRRCSGGQTILRGFPSSEIFAVGAADSQLQHLAVLQVAETQAACSGDEDVEHGPAQAEAAGLTWKPTDHLCSAPDFFE